MLKYGVAIPSTCEFFETHRDHLLAVLKSLGFVARVSVKANSEKEIVGRQFYDSLIKELCGKNNLFLPEFDPGPCPFNPGEHNYDLLFEHFNFHFSLVSLGQANGGHFRNMSIMSTVFHTYSFGSIRRLGKKVLNPFDPSVGVIFVGKYILPA